MRPRSRSTWLATVSAMPNLVDRYNAVPFFVIDQKYGFSGAQPPEVIAQILERVQKESL